MEEYLRTAGQWVGWAAEAAGVIIIVVAIVRGLGEYVLQLLQRSTPLPRTRIRLNLARSLALSLEFLLAADIVQTAIAPSWDDIGKLAAIAAIRTGLNYFLGQEIEKEGREVQSDRRQEPQQKGAGTATS
ncbi:MAG: DUF1622 domain-containing protein [Chloroflexota bacterium]